MGKYRNYFFQLVIYMQKQCWVRLISLKSSLRIQDDNSVRFSTSAPASMFWVFSAPSYWSRYFCVIPFFFSTASALSPPKRPDVISILDKDKLSFIGGPGVEVQRRAATVCSEMSCRITVRWMMNVLQQIKSQLLSAWRKRSIVFGTVNYCRRTQW